MLSFKFAYWHKTRSIQLNRSDQPPNDDAESVAGPVFKTLSMAEWEPVRKLHTPAFEAIR